jgi:hypothetical protein
MPFVAVPHAAEFTIKGKVEGQDVINTFNALFTGVPTLPDLQTAAGTLGGIWAGNILPHVGSSYSFLGVHGRGLSTIVDIECDEDGDAGVGTATGQTLPNNVAFCLKRLTGFSGRSARGRVYISGLTDSSLTGTNEANVGVANALRTALNLIAPAWAPNDWTEVVISRFTGGIANIPPVTRAVVEYAYTDLVLDSMRRRLPGRGA